MYIKLLKNIILFVGSIFLISTITFFIFEIIPGEAYDLDFIKEEAVIINIRQRYGLDRPLFERYFLMLRSVFTLDFGYSFTQGGLSVNSIIKNHFPYSAKIGVIALFFSFSSGIFLACIINNIKKKLRWIFYLFFIVVISSPTFVLAALLQYFFSVRVNLFPILWTNSIHNYILPCLVISSYPTVFITRLMSRNMQSVEKLDYTNAARARGINSFTILVKFVIKNSLTPVLSYLGPLCTSLLVGSFIVETIFNIPGLARYFITSVTNRDYPAVIGLTVFYALILISVNFLSNSITVLNDYKGKRVEE